ncbi:MAG TPA: glycosyltransferase family 4 protein, partial [Patescibacteria group bacterium]|nr:glycosyltransferase family 4 protein [Patescibacteria group bacterium]
MRVALVYDRVNKFGGAERVLLALKKLYPDAPLYTLVYNKPTAPWAKVFKVIPTFFNKLKFLRRRHEILAPFSALAFETFDLKEFDVVISVTSDQAKAVITRPETLHLCYCLTPTRYL